MPSVGLHIAKPDARDRDAVDAAQWPDRNREHPVGCRAESTTQLGSRPGPGLKATSSSGVMRAVSADAPREESRRQAALLFAEVLDSAGLTHERAGRALGVSRQLVTQKANPERADKSVTLADVLDLIDGAPDAGDTLVRALAARVAERRGARTPAPEMAMRLWCLAMSIVGEVCVEVGTSVGPLDTEKVLGTCAQLHAQLARFEACVRGMR